MRDAKRSWAGRGVLLVAMARAGTGGWAGTTSEALPPPPDFRRDIQPLLKEHCLSCHGPTKQSGGFRFDRRGSVRKVSGRLQPGSSATSRVYLRLASGDFGQQMPPSGALADEQIALVKDWIDRGAEWPDELAGDEAPLPIDPDASRMADAIRLGDRPAFRRLLDAQPQSVNRRALGGATPLVYAALYGDADAAARLLARGADPNLASGAGATALMLAVGDLPLAKLLLDHGADVNAMSDLGQTPLSIAAGRAGSASVVSLLLDRGATPTPASPAGRTQPGSRNGVALVQAASAGDEAAFRTLIARGAEPKAAGGLGLVLAARSGCGACVDTLMASASPADLGYALVALGPFGDERLLARLIERGADVNVRLTAGRRDMKGRTPLMMAASSDRVPTEAVAMLLARGADVGAIGPEGETALDLARRNGDTAVVQALVRAGAKPGRGFPVATVTPRPAASVRDALARILPVLQRSDVTFVQKTGCVSCHNDTLTAMTVATARANGVPVDEDVARAQRKAIASILEGRRDAALVSAEITNTASNILVALAAEGHPPDATTDAAAFFLKGRQLADGRWRNFFVDHRPPMQGSDIEPTATAIRALRAYAPRARREDYEAAVARGLAWLMGATPRTNDERALQLLGFAWGGVDGRNERVRSAARALLAEQRPDGGWGQLPTLGSDAFATGQAMVALHESGALRVTDAAYQRGVRYLLGTQLADGSWYVSTRSMAFQPYFESGFPHGPDQWISMAASNWASMALAPAAAPARRSLREQRGPVDDERERRGAGVVLTGDGEDLLSVR